MRATLRLLSSLLMVSMAFAASPVWAKNDRPDDGSPDKSRECRERPDPSGKALGLRRRCPPSTASAGIARGDFNGDGIADLAIGAPGEDAGSLADAGSVTILYGSSEGLSTGTALTVLPPQGFTQDSTGVSDAAEAGDAFGAALAAGNFNGDAFSDLAIGVPEESIGQAFFTGAIHVLYGSAAGLVAGSNQFVTLAGVGIANETRANFGKALAWGDFDRDGFGDLAIGAPAATAGTVNDAGLVVVLFGGPTGIATAGRQVLHQTAAGAPAAENFGGTAVGAEDFGRSLGAGDFNTDGATDLAVGVPLENVSASLFDTGSVYAIYGSASGLNTSGVQIWSQDSSGIPDSGEATDQFGSGLTSGDFDGDGDDDLVVGVPLEAIGSESDAGAVNVIYGSPAGLVSTGAQFWSQNTTGILDTSESSDFFGSGLAANDFNGDGFEDLAVGARLETINGNFSAGSVNVIYGSASRLSATAGPGNQFWHQDVGAVNDVAEASDYFGSSLSAWNFGRTSHADLAIGVPREDVVVSGVTHVDAGAVSVLYGSGAGLTDTSDQLWTQNSANVPDAVEAGDLFGTTVY